MDKVRHFFELKKRWVKSNESERIQIDQEICELLDSLTPEEVEALEQGVSDDLANIHQRAEELADVITIRNQMNNILPIISVSYLAKHYFGKSTSWFYQRLNGNEVHGRVCRFTKEEIETLNNALKDIGNKISTLSLSY